MFSGGQTQNSQATAAQSPPHVWCSPLSVTDIGGLADSSDGIVDGWDCRTPPALDAVKPLVCSNTLEEEKLSQCTDRLTDVYMINWRRSPENLRPVFEGFVELFVNSLFKTCSADQSTPQSAGQCMWDAFTGGNILINLWGSDFTLSKFIIKLADMLSGQPLPVCTFTQIQAGTMGLTCRGATEGWSMPNPGQSDEGPETACLAATSAQIGVLMTKPSEEEQHAYMHEHNICHDEPQTEPQIQFEIGNPALTEQPGGHGCNPFLGAPCE